ncbi:23S rRNA (uracil(1939)-C(5))-methyltransferase RlmD [Sodaliphilus pleomorphus]|uniref:23S rRNA (uracil(1939)-C(5))-methyltransferase RlmD n=1 Tax=Sodaliphilus pleomorphus TaxID=2606626 RepID=UPI0024094EBB|nr:23S rRNA (uracil(1939)-C(5))-methyltransferase RlmD [Sodaliphilus pleomorphus]MDD6687615.1 23S rRNA (uracil(1939)-C(5))-methyltransferase RlmD [Sodaliphilus pleomorphus]
MSRKRKELPVVEGLEITKIAAEGKSLARWNDMVVFIPYGAPGDVADVKIDRKKHSFAEGHIVNLVKPSEIRIQPFCEHFGVCGGCKFQHIPYEYQLKYKQQQVVDALERIAKVDLPQVNPILGSQCTTAYRNKLEFTFSDKEWLTTEQLHSGEQFPDRNAVGFHIPNGYNKVLDIKKCWLMDDINNQLRLFVKQYALSKGYTFFDMRNNTGLMRMMMIRVASTGQLMLVVVFGEHDGSAIVDVMNAVHERFPSITSLMHVVNTKRNDSLGDQTFVLDYGKEYIEEEMEGLKFRVGPKSFYQTNSRQAYELYKVARRMARLTGDELVYDLYTGTGTIANFVSRQARKVIGIEYVPEAIADAKLNSEVNGIDNTYFVAGDMKDVLTFDFIAQHGVPDVMIIDPPRAGMHQDVVNVILNAEPKRMVYVSCNPATQARDLQLLDAKYKVVEIQPVDMFPHTQHVENVVALERRF